MYKANVLVTNIRVGLMRKVLIVEAKKFPDNAVDGWHNQYDWGGVETQLSLNMNRARRQFGNVQTMYGMVTVGDMVRFYYMSMNTPVGILRPFTLPAGGNTVTLSVHTNRNEIHDILIAIEREISTYQNRY
ncbi:hypothetical protein BDV39DRAFT_200329 [Aspergillus sergii]|uniref:Uncharacterized protein n=1 Tax=Aspergillus sergii TaxID=1034303 RepID=A0A5N6XFZ3_9EURO|nr:hypothetical protein BDV39DRAFT_200329 [Aspergillus sergii]